MPLHSIVSREDWITARKALLVEEKRHTRDRDRLNQARLALPWVKIEQPYIFDTPTGPQTLAQIFAGRSQLLIYHFMVKPGWDAGCVGCSFLADHLDGAMPHLNHHDVSLVVVSRAPLPEIQDYQRRMGWSFPWVSSAPGSFNFDFHVSFTPEQIASGEAVYNYAPYPSTDVESTEAPGLSAFALDGAGHVFHTYSTYARGPEELIGTFMLLDRAPLGRNEDKTMHFVRRHDEYTTPPAPHACCS